MNKNIMWTVIGLALLGVIAGACCTLFVERLSIVTLDINPSIELIVTKREKIKSVRALNDDAKVIVSDNLNNMPLKEAIEEIAKRTVQEGFAPYDKVTVLLHIDGKLSEAVLQNDIRKAFEKEDKTTEIVVPLITDDAITNATQYNITPTKAAYISMLVAINKELVFDDMVKKSTIELAEMKNTGFYCDSGYNLRDGKCYKKSSEEEPVEGKSCPKGYEEKDNKCYETSETEDQLYCTNGQKLEGEKCVGTITVDAKVNCSEGSYNSKSGKCELLTYDSVGTKKCSGDGKISNYGKCTFSKPMQDGACLGGDTLIDGLCYDMNKKDGDSPSITCPTGTVVAKGNKGEACYKKTESNPTYTCESGYTLSETKCTSDKENTTKSKKGCPSGFTMFENRICLNYNETIDYTTGFICKNKNAELEDDKCIIYEIVEAKGKK